jgi:hypothetical protein
LDDRYGLVTNMAERTRAELERLLRPPIGEENELDRWRREVYQQELEHLDAREKREREERAVATGDYMKQWYTYFDNVIANERAAMAEQVREQVRSVHDVLVEAAGEALAEVRREIETQNKCALDIALAGVKKDVATALGKQKTLVDKLLAEVALLKRQMKLLEDAHNKQMQNSLTHLHDRVSNMESERRVGNESAIKTLQTRLAAAEDELRGTAKLDKLPAWITDR